MAPASTRHSRQRISGASRALVHSQLRQQEVLGSRGAARRLVQASSRARIQAGTDSGTGTLQGKEQRLSTAGHVASEEQSGGMDSTGQCSTIGMSGTVHQPPVGGHQVGDEHRHHQEESVH